MASATVGNSLTDAQSQAGSLHKIVEFDKAVEDRSLFLLGNSSARILAIDVDTVNALVSRLFSLVYQMGRYGCGGRLPDFSARYRNASGGILCS